MAADVLAVIVTYNSERTIGGLLDSVPAAMGTLTYHVTVVDNGSSDGTVAAARRHRVVGRLIRSPNLGYAAGLNIGVSGSAASAMILLLNPDARLCPGSVPPLMAAMSGDRVGVAAPMIVDERGTLAPSLRRDPSLGRSSGLAFTRLALFSEYVTDPAQYERAHDIDWALGAALAIDAECFDQLNGWDESYFLYSEETDFCLRARDAGWRVVYEPASVVMHMGGGSGRSDRTHAMQIVNRVRLYGRRHGALPSRLHWALTIASEFSWLVRGHRASAASLGALLVPARRPVELGAGRVLGRGAGHPG